MQKNSFRYPAIIGLPHVWFSLRLSGFGAFGYTVERQIVEKDCQAHGLNREDAMDCTRCLKQISDD